jgi:predicted ABC-type ATPase
LPRPSGTTDAIVIAGANGAGKTTFALELLPTLYPGVEFLNADEVQAESSVLAHPVAAGREMLRRLGQVERRRTSFALETTLSSTMYVRRIRAWRYWGYRVSLHFIELPSEDFAVQRVAMRVAAGGHSVPEADVRRRYHRGLDLFERIYKPLVDEWYHWFGNEEGLRLGQQAKR